ncbi:ankyrin repeat domain-containing protein [Pirellulaceae bacterium SH501]
MSRVQMKAETYIRRRNLRKLRCILKKHPRLKHQEFNSLLLFAHAFNRGVMQFLIDLGVRTSWHDGNNLLMHAAFTGDQSLLRLAFKNGIDINARNQHGETALGYAISYERIDCAKILVAWGADVDIGETEFRGGYIGEARRLGLRELVEVLEQR